MRDDIEGSSLEMSAPARPLPIPALTGFRFVAAMMVVLSHYAIPGVEGTGARMASSGYAGVTFFFVLSGFVITYNYLDAFEKGAAPGMARDYIVARLARIYPLYLLCLLPGWAVASSTPWYHLFALQAWHPDMKVAFGINGPAWSISVEFFLYLAFPLLVQGMRELRAICSKRNLVIAAILVIMVLVVAALGFTWSGRSALSGADPDSAHRWLYRTPWTRLGDFLLGMLGAVYILRFASRTAGERRAWRIVGGSCLVVVLLLAASRKFFLSAFSWDVAYAVPASLLFIWLAIDRETWIARMLSSRPLLLLGESSYALYLVHVVPGIVRPAPLGNHVTDISAYLVFIALLVMASIGLHVTIEKPARRYIRSFFGAPRPAP
ncbi:Acyltransferase [Burkholderiales bacterium 8X]|nr:Acyltransferase [Burkholderiales bacterium 8X]